MGSAWTIECETYFSASDPANYKFMPTSAWHVWDLAVRDQDNRDVTGYQQCYPSASKPLNCNWFDGARKGDEQTYISSSPGPAPSPGPSSCQDIQSASDCATWRAEGFCLPSSGDHYAFSKYYCRKTCNFCDMDSAPPVWDCFGN